MNYPDAVDLVGHWLKDGIPLMAPDCRTQMDQHSATLTIEETFGDDSAVYTFRLTTPFGEAETHGSLMVSETHKSVIGESIDEEVIAPLRQTRPQLPPVGLDEEAPRFTK
ncbi:unnamed protein product [Dibothriocephalus latus]|uniref:Immunoglobulin I-set domain-containing protein n=1 Tax=Dibothriocephalus latus TaxID=60516 RepID=A0A3P7RCI8_DIBLA|nr:unnamed protein product [Dibothriocephalus latus]